jgi:N-ethylmaleimide reductase
LLASPAQGIGQHVVDRQDRQAARSIPDSTITASTMTDLFTPLTVGPLELPNRILMAPLTRCRAEADHVPGPLMAEYHRQREGAGLVIAEATMVMEGNSAFWREPGIHSPAQVAGWRLCT